MDLVVLFRGVPIRRSVMVVVATDVKNDTTGITHGVHLVLEPTVRDHDIAPTLVREPHPEMPDPEFRVHVRPKDIRPYILQDLARRLPPPRIHDFFQRVAGDLLLTELVEHLTGLFERARKGVLFKTVPLLEIIGDGVLSYLFPTYKTNNNCHEFFILV